MKDFQNKNKKSFMRSLPVLVILFLFLILFAAGVVDFAGKARDAYRKRKVAEEKISELKDRKDKLEKDIGDLNTDLGKERVFRENYGLGKPGEEVIVVVENKDEKTPQVAEKSSLFKRFMSLFQW